MKMIHMDVPGSRAATLEGYILDCEIADIIKYNV